MVTETYNFEKTVGGDGIASVYAKQNNEYSTEILSDIVGYTLSLNGTSYSSLADPTSDLEWSVNDVIAVYEDETGNDYAYLASNQILKGLTSQVVEEYIITSITVNNVSKSSIVEKDIKNSDIVSLTLSSVYQGGGSND